MNEIIKKIKFLEKIKEHMLKIQNEIVLVYDLIIKEANEGKKEIEIFEKIMNNRESKE